MGKKQQGSALPRVITVRGHKAGETLQLTFTLNGVLCWKPLSVMEVNAGNIKYAERFLGEIQNRIVSGDFNYPRGQRTVYSYRKFCRVSFSSTDDVFELRWNAR